jgi:hypothetical protein
MRRGRGLCGRRFTGWLEWRRVEQLGSWLVELRVVRLERVLELLRGRRRLRK